MSQKTGNEDFDGSEVCELIGLFILHKLTSIVNKFNIDFIVMMV